MHKVNTNDNLADIFTTPLVGDKLLEMRAKVMGLPTHKHEQHHGNEYFPDETGDGAHGAETVRTEARKATLASAVQLTQATAARHNQAANPVARHQQPPGP